MSALTPAEQREARENAWRAWAETYIEKMKDSKSGGPVNDDDEEKCPKCGGDLTFGYGLAAGPIGGYVLCLEDGCDYEKVYPDKSVEQPTDPNTVTCLHQVK